MTTWFQVPGQGSPMGMGILPCENNFDCQNHTTLKNGSVPWTTGKISSSSAGNLVCDPFRKKCVMKEKFEKEDYWWIGVL